MERLAYSSTAAFLAHYRILSNAAADDSGIYPLSKREAELLTSMRHVMEALTPEERSVLVNYAAGNEQWTSGEERRRYERAQLKARRILLSKGIVQG
jgi:hypothetical protein